MDANYTVYPRWRGEHVITLEDAIAGGGLSPLARGTRSARMLATETARFIPAGAGNTARLIFLPCTAPVYPRWRGEHPRSIIDWNPFPGLSPLARGTLSNIIKRFKCYRFIPAGAGNTPQGWPQLCRLSVYPRWRGEHLLGSFRCAPVDGLSPLARGTLTHRLLRALIRRFIPAGAGNTFARRAQTSMSQVYPRWRGEHNVWQGYGDCMSGLSPLARGTH